MGCYDGTVKVFDVRKKENVHIFMSDIRTGKHTDPVWQVRPWCSRAAHSLSYTKGALCPTSQSCHVLFLCMLYSSSFYKRLSACVVTPLQVRWQAEDVASDMSFFSVSSDGRVASWSLSKNELKMEPVMTLKLTSGSKDVPDEESSLTGECAAN